MSTMETADQHLLDRLPTRLAIKSEATEVVGATRKSMWRKLWDWRPRTRNALLSEMDYYRAEAQIAAAWLDLERSRGRAKDREIERLNGKNVY